MTTFLFVNSGIPFLLMLLLIVGTAVLAIFINVRTLLHLFNVHNREVQIGAAAAVSMIFLIVFASGSQSLFYGNKTTNLLFGAITGISYTARKLFVSQKAVNGIDIKYSGFMILFQLSISAIVGAALTGLLFLVHFKLIDFSFLLLQSLRFF